MPGVPVVDLTETLRGLHEHADAARADYWRAMRLAATCAQRADYLDNLARTLEGQT